MLQLRPGLLRPSCLGAPAMSPMPTQARVQPPQSQLVDFVARVLVRGWTWLGSATACAGTTSDVGLLAADDSCYASHSKLTQLSVSSGISVLDSTLPAWQCPAYTSHKKKLGCSALRQPRASHRLGLLGAAGHCALESYLATLRHGGSHCPQAQLS